MSESGDYDPGPWRGYNFREARSNYDRHAGRSYSEASSSVRSIDELVPRSLSTESESPMGIAIDVTSSMEEWPSVIFSKLPYLENEGKEYLGRTFEVSFAAVGDAHSDEYPLQVRPFTSGRGLERELKKLIHERKGGPGKRESYDLAALYYARNVRMPKATKPLFVFIGDEALYDIVSSDQAKQWARTTIEGRLTSKAVMDELKRKFSVYLVRKPYHLTSDNVMTVDDQIIQGQWEKYLGADHVALLPDPNRVVDVIFGIMAKETSRIEYFHEEITGRQKPDQVKTVIESLHRIHDDGRKKPEPINEEKSITRGRVGGKEVKSLL